MHIPCSIDDECHGVVPGGPPTVEGPWRADYPLYPFQARAVEFAAVRRGAIITGRPGMGRFTAGVAVGALHLNESRGIERVIVLTPAVLLAAGAHEITELTGESVVCVSALELGARSAALADARWIVVPYQLAARATAALASLASSSMVVVDQVQRVKNPTAQCTQVAYQLARACPRRLVLGARSAMSPPEWAGVLTGVVDPEFEHASTSGLHALSGGRGPAAPETLLREHFALSSDQLELAVAIAPTWSTSLRALAEAAVLLRPPA